jgi:hypothetical protein
MPYKTHGMSYSPEYKTWVNMISRCKYPSIRNYKWYGGRGIKVCDRWLTFKNFYEDMGNRPSGKFTLERIDNDGNYEPDNCIWALATDNKNNTRANRKLTFNGKTLSVSQWARELNINKYTIAARLRYGWPVESVLSEPIKMGVKLDHRLK